MTLSTEKIFFHYVIAPFYFPHRNRLKTFIHAQLANEGKEVEVINYVFCDDAYLLDMNLKYLNHDTLTDIITFEISPDNYPLVADIYISVERVRENAEDLNIPFTIELRRVLFHGSLHLAGYKDKSKSHQNEMRSKEDEWLSAFAVSRETNSKKL